MRVYNTFTRHLDELKLDRKVKMYVCGITAYDYSHIGHARSSVFFDTVKRYLEYEGYEVVYIQNFTDVDDKIVNRAVKESSTQKEISTKFIHEYLKDMEDLNVRETNQPLVSKHIPHIVDAVRKLVEKGYAYQVDGDVYFHVPSFHKYGELSEMSLSELDQHRIEPDTRKKDIKDFALWKSAKDEDFQAEAAFDSPWGKGRPGWHIECSVLAHNYLGAPFDIHGGGKDLIFPHHENERAQSYALTDNEPVRYWMHNDFITVKGEKMSKSLGNIIKIRDLLHQYQGEVIRYFLLASHYRSALDYSEKALETAQNSYLSLKNTLELVDMELAARNTFGTDSELVEIDVEEYRNKFELAMEDDFNIPKALSVLHELSGILNRTVNQGTGSNEQLEGSLTEFKQLCKILGLFEDHQRIPVLDEGTVELIRERETARSNKDFSRADSIRDELKGRGIKLVDTPRGTRWYIE
ncbi:MAG: cysteine--tRNA ligase [Archaeoglobaceae archaeon]